MAEEVCKSSKKQVVPFKSFNFFRSHVERHLDLKRVKVQEIEALDTLDGCYFGGKVVNAITSSFSQGGGTIVFVEDGDVDSGCDVKHASIKISAELTEHLPSLDEQFMLFVGGAFVEDEDVEFTQDAGVYTNLVTFRASSIKGEVCVPVSENFLGNVGSHVYVWC